MPIFEVELSDGRIVELEAPTQPSESDVLSAIGGQPSEPEGKSLMQRALTPFVSIPEIPERKDIVEAGKTMRESYATPSEIARSRLAGAMGASPASLGLMGLESPSAAGVARSAAGLGKAGVEFFESPAGVATMGASLIPGGSRLAGGLWAAYMLANAPEAMKAAAEKAYSGDPGAKAEGIADAVINAALPVALGAGVPRGIRQFRSSLAKPGELQGPPLPSLDDIAAMQAKEAESRVVPMEPVPGLKLLEEPPLPEAPPLPEPLSPASQALLQVEKPKPAPLEQIKIKQAQLLRYEAEAAKALKDGNTFHYEELQPVISAIKKRLKELGSPAAELPVSTEPYVPYASPPIAETTIPPMPSAPQQQKPLRLAPEGSANVPTATIPAGRDLVDAMYQELGEKPLQLAPEGQPQSISWLQGFVDESGKPIQATPEMMEAMRKVSQRVRGERADKASMEMASTQTASGLGKWDNIKLVLEDTLGVPVSDSAAKEAASRFYVTRGGTVYPIEGITGVKAVFRKPTPKASGTVTKFIFQGEPKTPIRQELSPPGSIQLPDRPSPETPGEPKQPTPEGGVPRGKETQEGVQVTPPETAPASAEAQPISDKPGETAIQPEEVARQIRDQETQAQAKPAAKTEVANAEGIRSDTGLPGGTGEVVRRSPENRGNDVEQASPKQPQPVVEGGQAPQEGAPVKSEAVLGALKPATLAARVQASKPPVTKAEQTAPIDPSKARQQKKYLLSEIDKAIKEAPEESRLTGSSSESDAARLEEATKKAGFVDERNIPQTNYDILANSVYDLFDKYSIPIGRPEKPAMRGISGEIGIPKIPAETYSMQTRIRLLSEAIDRARFEQGDNIVIDVPGDGTFVIRNTRSALMAFKDKAQRFPTTTVKSSAPKSVRTTPSQLGPVESQRTTESVLKALDIFRSEDPNRGSIRYIYSNGTEMVSTDGRRMLVVEHKGKGTEKNPVLYGESGDTIANGAVVGETKLDYPKYNQVWPDKTESLSKSVDASRLYSLVKQAMAVFYGQEAGKSTPVYLEFYDNGTIGVVSKNGSTGDAYASSSSGSPKQTIIVNGSFLMDMLEAARKLGSEKIDLLHSGGDFPVLISRGKGWRQILMPMRGEGTSAEIRGEVIPPTKSGSTKSTSQPPSPTPSSQALGIAPGAAEMEAIVAKVKEAMAAGKERVKQVANRVLPDRSRQAGQAPVIDTGNPLPDFAPREVNKKLFAQPFGFEKIPGLGFAFNPARGGRIDPLTESLLTHSAEYHGVGKGVSSALGLEIQGKINSVFSADKQGNLNVRTTSEGQSLKISDVFESLQRNPQSYRLTPEQKRVWQDVIQPILKRRRQLVDQYDLVELPDTVDTFDSYFPRIVTKEKPVEGYTPRGLGGERVGSKQFFQKERRFNTEREGWDSGWEYETDIERRLVSSIDRLYKAMADRRLIDDPALGARTRKQLEADLNNFYAEELGAGSMTPDTIRKIADSIQSKGTVYQPGFSQKIFSPEVASRLNRAFPQGRSTAREYIVKGNNFFKAAALGFDLGVPFIQGQITMFKNPAVWAKAFGKSLQAFMDKDAMAGYARRNIEPIRELSQLGSPVGQLQEMLAGMERGELIRRIPVVGHLAGQFARQFSTFIDVAKVELWKAMREVTPREQWSQAVQAIESQLMISRMEASGLGRNRNLAERVLFLAPSYYRGALNLISLVGQKGVAGNVGRKAIGSYIAAGTATFVGVGLALGMSWDDITRRLNPTARDFGLWQIKRKDGTTMEVGFGGILRSLIKLAGNMAQTSIEHPENWKSLASDKNPISRWLRGHLAPVPALNWDAWSGRDYMGREVEVTQALEQLLPLWAKPSVVKKEKVPPQKAEYVATFIGLTSFGLTPEQKVRILANEFKDRHGIKRPMGMYEESPYSKLEWFLRTNQPGRAKKAYDELLLQLKSESHPESPKKRINDHFRLKIRTLYTGSTINEHKFMKELHPELRKVYDSARQDNLRIYRAVRAMNQ